MSKPGQTIYKAIVEAIPHPVMVLDLAAEIICVNEAASEFFERGKTDLEGMYLSEMVGEHEPLKTIPIANLFSESLVVPSLAVRFLTARGKEPVSQIALRKFALVNESNFDYVLLEISDQEELTEAVEIAEDCLKAEQLAREHLLSSIVELSSTQEQLIQAEKLSSLGTLVAGVAHELNNPMNFISSNFELMIKAVTIIEKNILEVMTDNPKAKPFLEFLNKNFEKIHEAERGHLLGMSRAITIIDSLLTYSRKGGTEKKPIRFDQIAEIVETILRDRLRNVTFERELTSQNQLLANLQELSQVVMNILDNAVYAALHGPNQSNAVVGIRSSDNSGMVQIEIWDNGSGIPEALKNSIFDPFVTSKPVGEGTGMGLSICHKIIQSHSGFLTVENTVQGALFRISIPSIGEKDSGNG